MDTEKIYEELSKKISSSKILKNESMAKHTSFKIGGNADILVKAKTVEDIKEVQEFVNKNKIPLCIMGNGSNILVRDNGIRGIVLLVEIENYNITKKETTAIIEVGAGVKLAKLSYDLLKKTYKVLNLHHGIPGTIGGAVYMNAGAHGKEMKDIVLNTTYIDEAGNIKNISNREHKFSYRKSIFQQQNVIIIQTTLELPYGNKQEIEQKMEEYAKYRKEKQPITFPSAGSTFKRGEDYITAKLIDDCGLKGVKIGGAQISDLHAGFIVNTGNATAKDVEELIEYTIKEVQEKFNKTIELELKIIGE